MPRPSVPAILVTGGAVATVGALLAGVWLVFGLGWALIAVAPVFAFLTWLASTLAPDDKPSSPPPASAVIPPPPTSSTAPVPPVHLITPKVRADA